DVGELERVLALLFLGVDGRADDGEARGDDGVLHAGLHVPGSRAVDDRHALAIHAVSVVADAARPVGRAREVADYQLGVVALDGETTHRLRRRVSRQRHERRYQDQPSPARPAVHSWFSSLRANAAGSNSLATDASIASKKSNSMSCLMRSVTRLAPLSESTASAGWPSEPITSAMPCSSSKNTTDPRDVMGPSTTVTLPTA